MATEELSFEALTLANLLVTKHLMATLLASGRMTKGEAQAAFDAAQREFHRATQSVLPEQVQDLLGMFWADYVPTHPDAKLN